MSLMVGVYKIDPGTGELGEFLWPEPENAYIAGFESYRYELWGHEALIRRGAAFLPQLRRSDLYVFPEELDAFERECAIILSDAYAIANEITPPVVDMQGIEFRVGNFLKAIGVARKIGGVVYIG